MELLENVIGQGLGQEESISAAHSSLTVSHETFPCFIQSIPAINGIISVTEPSICTVILEFILRKKKPRVLCGMQSKFTLALLTFTDWVRFVKMRHGALLSQSLLC